MIPQNSDLTVQKSEEYERPSVTVDMLLFTVDDRWVDDKKLPEKELKLLLVKRRNSPYLNHWAIPGGFVGTQESIEQVALRELKELTHVQQVYLEQLYTWGSIDRDPRMRVISVSYLALAPKQGIQTKTGKDVLEAAWFVVRKTRLLDFEDTGTEKQAYLLSLEKEDNTVKMGYIVTDAVKYNGVTKTVRTNLELLTGTQEKLAFDHDKMVNLALERLRNKVVYTPIAFNLMPEEFTLGELQKVYETLLGKALYKANFRKKVLPMVLETEKKTENVKHRPSQFYRFNPNYKEV